MIHPLHPFQSLATLNAIGLACAVWRDRRELHFVEAIVAGRREGKMRRAQARRWRKRKTVPSGANQTYPPAAPALPPSWRRGLPSSASMQDEQVDEKSAAPNGAAALAPATEATLSAYQSMVRSAALALADADEPQGSAASAHVSAEVLGSTTQLSSPLLSPLSSPLPPPLLLLLSPLLSSPLPPPLLSSPLPSPLPSPPDRDARDGNYRSEISTTDEASEASSVWLSEIALAEESGVFDEEKDLMRGIVRAGNGMILSQMGPEVT